MKIKPLKKTLYIVSTLILLSGCSNKEAKNLKIENENLKKEIEDLKYGPSKLLEEGKRLFDNNNLEKAASTFRTLIAKHPDTEETLQARTYLSQTTKAIKEEKLNKEKEEKERLSNATKKLRSEYDDIRNITWFYDKTTPIYSNVNNIHLYMATYQNSPPKLRFRIQYADKDWLFIKNYIIKTDSKTHTIHTSYGDVKKDNGHSGIWEWYDIGMNRDTYEIVLDIINSKESKIRHNGTQYYKDRNITKKEKEAMKNMIDAYEAIGGSLNI